MSFSPPGMSTARRSLQAMGRRLAIASAFSLATLHAAPVLATTDDDGPSPFHIELELAYGHTVLEFVSAEDARLCVTESCQPADESFGTASTVLAAGHGAINFELSYAFAAVGGPDHSVGGIGFRLDPWWAEKFGVYFRGGYVHRWGDFAGNGGRASIGFVVRPCDYGAAFIETGFEVASVPTEVRDQGTLLSHAWLLSLGVRADFLG